MQKIAPLEYGCTYHIYNRGINSADIFSCEANYKRFLSMYGEYITSVADTYAWVLLRNHFHLLVRIKDKEEIPYMIRPQVPNQNSPLSGSPLTGLPRQHPDSGRQTLSAVNTEQRPAVNTEQRPAVNTEQRPAVNTEKKYIPSKQFSHLFNAYAKFPFFSI